MRIIYFEDYEHLIEQPRMYLESNPRPDWQIEQYLVGRSDTVGSLKGRCMDEKGKIAYDAVILDVKFHGEVERGMSLWRELAELQQEVRPWIIIYTGAEDIHRSVHHCDAFFRKGQHGVGEIMKCLYELEQRKELEREEGKAEFETRGVSPAIDSIRHQILQVASTDAPVLIIGESGTGKELVAKDIHSPQSSLPFVAINCAAIPSELIESELFGHEVGAFTGAVKMKRGAFELASPGGILFLDEIGDMSITNQAKILRAISEGQIRRVGGTEDIKVDVRIIAATNRDLAEMVREGEFRLDLYYRLCVFPIFVPPLRDREQDFEELVRSICSKRRIATEKVRGKADIDIATQLLRLNHDWPGNVREMENILVCASALSNETSEDGRRVISEDLVKKAFELQQIIWKSRFARKLDKQGVDDLIEIAEERFRSSFFSNKFANLLDQYQELKSSSSNYRSISKLRDLQFPVALALSRIPDFVKLDDLEECLKARIEEDKELRRELLQKLESDRAKQIFSFDPNMFDSFCISRADIAQPNGSLKLSAEAASAVLKFLSMPDPGFLSPASPAGRKYIINLNVLRV